MQREHERGPLTYKLRGVRGDTYIWKASGKRVPSAECKHSSAEIVQPGEWDRLRDAWINWCRKCDSLIAAQTVRARVVGYVRNIRDP